MDARLRTILVTVIGIGIALGLAACIFMGLRSGFSLWVGAGLATANLYALAKLVVILVPADEKHKAAPGGTGAWLVVGLLKMAFLFGGVWLLMSFKVVELMPLFVGFACLPIGIAIGSIVSDRRAEKAA